MKDFFNKNELGEIMEDNEILNELSERHEDRVMGYAGNDEYNEDVDIEGNLIEL